MYNPFGNLGIKKNKTKFKNNPGRFAPFPLLLR